MKDTNNRLETTLEAVRSMNEEWQQFLNWSELEGKEAEIADEAIDAEYLDMVNEKFIIASRENKSELNNLIYEN